MDIILPDKRSEAKEENPKLLTIFGKPKSGKTTIIAALDNNLIIDMEPYGTDYIDCMAIKALNLEKLWGIKTALEERKVKYKFISLDTTTRLEEIVMPLAKKLYMDTPMGKNFKGDDVRKLPNGAGYMYLREAFFQAVDWFKPYCEYLILVGHANATMINKEGKELSEMDLDLSGKLKRLVAADSDALGYVYREKNKTIISFEGGEDSIVEARPQHIRGKKITIAESDKEGNLNVDWSKIYK